MTQSSFHTNQNHCMILHHMFAATCWRFSCLRLGQIFEIEPVIRQCMATAQRHASLSFLDIDVLPLYMYMKGQWTLSAPLYGPLSHVCSHLLAVLLPQVGSDFRNRAGDQTMYGHSTKACITLFLRY